MLRKNAPGCVANDDLNFLDILYPHILECFTRSTRVFQQPQALTLLDPDILLRFVRGLVRPGARAFVSGPPDRRNVGFLFPYRFPCSR